jgi:hypothetical protein
VIAFCDQDLKPVLPTVTLYCPGGKSGNSKNPWSELVLTVACAVSVLVSVTSLPGTAACDESTTVPVIKAVPCAMAWPNARRKNRPEKKTVALADAYLPLT